MADLHSRAHALAEAFEAERKRKIPVAPHPVQYQLVYVLAAGTEDWAGLEKLSSHEQKAAIKAAKRLAPACRALQGLYSKTGEFLDEASGGFLRLRDRPDWPEIREKIAAQLPSAVPSPETNRRIHELGAASQSKFFEAAYAPLNDRAERIDEMYASWQTSLAAADLASAVAALNCASGSASAQVTNDWVKEAASELTKRRRAIYLALRGRRTSALDEHASELSRWAQSDILTTAVRGAAAMAVARQASPGSAVLGRRAIAVADLIRDLLAAQVLGRRIRSMVQIGFGPLEDWFRAAESLSFKSSWAPPPRVSIKTVKSHPHQYDGKAVTLEGLVSDMQNHHQGRKVYSSCRIEESGGASVRMGLLYIKIDSGGLVDGAYAQATGTFHAQDPEFGVPLLRITRRSLAEESKSSWSDWVGLKTRDQFTPVPHALAIRHSWQRGLEGPGNQLRYGTWRALSTGDQ